MNCGEFREHLNELIEGSAGSKLRLELEKHRDVCSSCRSEYEETRLVVNCIKMDASSAVLTDKQRKQIKETILKVPIKKARGSSRFLRNFSYAAAIFMFITAGIYFSGGIKVNIGPAGGGEANLQVQVDTLKQENNNLRAESIRLNLDKEQFKQENEELKLQNSQLEQSVKEIETENQISQWMMINSNLGEAIIEGRVLSIDPAGRKVRLEIYRDDNTPSIDPDIIIPDGIYITRPIEGNSSKYSTKAGTIDDIKVEDHITIHYVGSTKSARAIVFLN